MAKAAFHKNQKVFVKPVGTWAVVEAVLPQWVKGLEEPLKIHYDVGLGREFSASELMADKSGAPVDDLADFDNWRINRARNRWKDSNEVQNHPQPGTYPVITTDEKLGRLARTERRIRPRSAENRIPGPHHRSIAAPDADLEIARPVRPQLFRRYARRTARTRQEGDRAAAPDLRDSRRQPERATSSRIGRITPPLRGSRNL